MKLRFQVFKCPAWCHKDGRSKANIQNQLFLTLTKWKSSLHCSWLPCGTEVAEVSQKELWGKWTCPKGLGWPKTWGKTVITWKKKNYAPQLWGPRSSFRRNSQWLPQQLWRQRANTDTLVGGSRRDGTGDTTRATKEVGEPSKCT